MDTQRLYSSSLGRIWLLIRADLHAQRRDLSILLGLSFVLLYLLPQLPLLFLFNDEALARAYALNIAPHSKSIYWLYTLASIYILYCYNRKVQHSKAMPFALYPASVWEKMLAMLGFATIVMLLCWGLITIGHFISWVMLPSEWADNLDLWPIRFDLVSRMSSSASINTLLMFNGYIIGPLWALTYKLTMIWGAISFRSLLKGLFLANLMYLGVLILMTLIGINAVLYRMQDVITEPSSYKLTIFSVLALVVVCGALVGGIYRKLKTIEL